MSFKFPRPFPFSRASATAGGLPYVALTPVDGDAGLSEACRIWWLLNTVTLTPTGSMTFGSTSGPSFSGSCALDVIEAPVSRIAVNSANQLLLGGAGSGSFYTETAWLGVAFVDSAWVLYYAFRFIVAGPPETGFGDYIIVQTFEITGVFYYPAYASGSFSLFGYTLPWYAMADNYYSASAISSAGLSATSTFHT